jgi:hypothetical protein
MTEKSVGTVSADADTQIVANKDNNIFFI